MPKISVIMAVHNLADEKVLNASVGSILKQSCRDLEFIICDDGSEDDTYMILDRYRMQDGRIRLLRNKRNRKAGFARNRCIKAARGKYIAVMDADDISDPMRMEKLYYFLERHSEYAFAGSRGEYFIRQPGDDGENYWYCRCPKPEDFLFSLPFVHASIMFRREALQKMHGYDTSRWVVRTEDYDLLLRMYGEGMRGYNLDEVLYYYRRDEGQYRRRKYRYRFHEAYIKYRGFKQMGMMPKAAPYVVKPLAVGLMPACIMKKVQKEYYSRK